MDLVPNLFIAKAMASCASMLKAPKLMALTTKCFTISSSDSTSSMLIGLRLKSRKSLRKIDSGALSTKEVNSLYFL